MFPRLRNFLTRSNPISEALQLPDSTDFIRFVRWRKRRWAPIPASKMYYVRKPTPVNEEEKAELLERNRKYATQMRSLRSYIIEAAKTEHDAEHQAMHLEEKRKEMEAIAQLNNKWNEETRLIREARVAAAKKIHEEKLLSQMDDLEMDKQKRAERARQRVLEAQAVVPTFVDLSDLEREIDQALNTRVSYNWAVDKDGKRYVEAPDGSIEVQDALQTPSKVEEKIKDPVQS
ncbi:hypothetical protein CAPTEDRAFT_224390 [Capitella teleta]|uniref:Small ribosomal subunit protein mS26 n=1 Tax=Capitella teleta TaxID=283909 RepID=R7UZ26_CAPTE|nr:hypothetical protein CAPTEDRAFT_224390 [Capitella teleta]|eukprot:ELU09197.1 hypothetical protein CAPTEDRAFT_224390 [Capitella teleta]